MSTNTNSQTSTSPVLTDAATKIVKADVTAFVKDGKRYSDYVVEMEVTTETVPEHVALFREAFKAAKPKADSAEVKAYATKVRNGLNYWTGKKVSSTPETDYLMKVVTAVEKATEHGITLDDIMAAISKK